MIGTIEKLEKKVNSSYSDKTRMPSIAEIEKLLAENGVKFESSSSVNMVEYRSRGNRYVNSRHQGKRGKKLTVNLSDEEHDKVGTYTISLDTSDSYYSMNTRGYARDILKLLKFRGKYNGNVV